MVDIKKQSTIHRHSKSLNEAVFTKFALKENPRFFEPLLKKPLSTVVSPPPTVKTLEELMRNNQNNAKRGSLLHKSMTTPEKSNIEGLTRQKDTMKMHIVTPLPFDKEENPNVLLENSRSEDEESSQGEENNMKISENPEKNEKKDPPKNEKKDPQNKKLEGKKMMEVLEKRKTLKDGTGLVKKEEETRRKSDGRKSFGSLKEEMKRVESKIQEKIRNGEKVYKINDDD